MIALWYAILATMITTYVVLDGRNFGAGILHWVVARTPAERRQVIAAIGPLWSWHEVWLVGTGGVMAMSFPRLMAVGFSGYYLALFLILWCVVLRGISIEVGGHIDDCLWQTLWDVVFAGSNVLLAVLFGVALGNVVRGAPLTREGSFHLTFFTNVFHTRGTVGLLDWYTLSMASFCVLMLAAHGATYLVMKTEGEVHRRADCIARSLWVAAIPAFGLISLLTGLLRPELLHGLIHRSLAWVPVMICAASMRALIGGLRQGQERRAFLGSTFLLFGLLMTGAVVLFPVLLFSTENAADQLTAYDCAAPAHSLWIATSWWFSALALAFIYLFVIQRYYAGKVNVSKDNQGLY
jgi:cytochrome d ubiquinol oxidase subunit II